MRNNIDDENLFDIDSILTVIDAFSTLLHGPILKKLMSMLSRIDVNNSTIASRVYLPFLTRGRNQSSNEFTAIRVV